MGLQLTSLILDMYIIFNWQLSYQEIHWQVSRDHITGTGLELIKVVWFFLTWPLTKCWFSFGSWARVRLTCWKQGWIVRKPVNANLGLKVNQIIIFSLVQFLVLFSFVYMVIIKNSWGQTVYRNLTAKLQNSHQNSTVSWVSLIVLWSTWSWSYAFRLRSKSIYYAGFVSSGFLSKIA